MLSARELKKAGLDVLLLDKGELGKESSWAGGGILSPLHPWRYGDEVSQLASIGHNLYPEIATELHNESGIDPEYQRSGLLVLDSQEQTDALAWAKKWRANLSVIEGNAEIQKIAPGAASSFKQGLWMPDIAQMRNPRLVKSVRGSLETLGVEYREHASVEKLNVVNGQVHGVEVNGKNIHAKQVLVTAGAWSAKILKHYAETPDISPVKGQMILFKGEPGLLKRILLIENRYLIPRKDGRVLCGSTIEHTGFDKSTSHEVKQNLLNSALEIFPQLTRMQVEHHWAGLRPGSPHGIPYIGQHKEIEGLYINAGHYRNGVILGIGSCQQIAADIIFDA
jgi:glycine oxidase